jgi:hypothetical protein
MALIVIGGHSQRVGKTSVVAGIIAALPEYRWSALKITPHGHGLESATGREKAPWAIFEETDRTGNSDTSRFLAAGAERAFWVRTASDRLVDAMPMVQGKLAEAKNAIVESNSVIRFLKPDLYFVVVNPEVADFKPSAREFLDCADAVILHCRPGQADTEWVNAKLKSAAKRPIFLITPPPYVTPEIVEFVRSALVSRNPVAGR